MLTESQIKRVQETWQMITPVSKEMGERFYSRLFENHPELRPMFKIDPKDQAMKLMFMISYLVHRLNQVQELQEEIIKLALRHKGYGTQIEQYQIIGENLMWSLQNNLGKEWDAETEQAWSYTYKFISDLMIGAHKV